MTKYAICKNQKKAQIIRIQHTVILKFHVGTALQMQNIQKKKKKKQDKIYNKIKYKSIQNITFYKKF